MSFFAVTDPITYILCILLITRKKIYIYLQNFKCNRSITVQSLIPHTSGVTSVWNSCSWMSIGRANVLVLRGKEDVALHPL